MAFFSKLMYTFNEVSIKISKGFLMILDKLALKLNLKELTRSNQCNFEEKYRKGLAIPNKY